MPTPRDMELYDEIKQQVMNDIPKHSAYRSGIIVQKYKEAFKEKHPNKQPYIGKKTQKVGLARWFKEEWKNQRGSIAERTTISILSTRCQLLLYISDNNKIPIIMAR